MSTTTIPTTQQAAYRPGSLKAIKAQSGLVLGIRFGIPVCASAMPMFSLAEATSGTPGTNSWILALAMAYTTLISVCVTSALSGVQSRSHIARCFLLSGVRRESLFRYELFGALAAPITVSVVSGLWLLHAPEGARTGLLLVHLAPTLSCIFILGSISSKLWVNIVSPAYGLVFLSGLAYGIGYLSQPYSFLAAIVVQACACLVAARVLRRWIADVDLYR